MPWLSDPIKRAREIKGAWRAVGGVVSAQAVTTLVARGNVDRTVRANVDRSVSGRGAHASIPMMGVLSPGSGSVRGATRFRY